MNTNDYYYQKDRRDSANQNNNLHSSYYDSQGKAVPSEEQVTQARSAYYDLPGTQPPKPKPAPPEITTFSSQAQTIPGTTSDDDQNDEERRESYRAGLRAAIRYSIKANDSKALPGLVARAPQNWTTKEFERAIKAAMNRDTSGELQKMLKLYNTISATPAGSFLKETLASLIERAEAKLEKMERQYARLLQDWQQRKASKTRDYLREQDVRAEKVVDVYRRHWIQVFFLSFLPLTLGFIDIVSFLVFNAFFPPLTALNLILTFIVVAWLGWTFNDWRNDYLMITNRRVMQYEKVTFFKEDKKSLLIERVEGVRYEANRSLFEFIFRIGTVTITGAGKLEIKFDRVYMPDRIRKEINDAKIAYMGSRNKFRSDRMENALRNKVLNEPLKVWDEEEPHVDAVPRDQLNWFQMMIPSDPIDEGGGQLVFRKHPLFLYRDWAKVIILYVILFLAAVFLLPIAFRSGSAILSTVAFIAFLLVFVWNSILLWYFWEDWYNDRYTLTNRDITDLEKKPFGLDEEKNVVPLAKVQDIELDQNGIVANFFDYGNVRVTTAGAGTPIVFKRVPDPDSVRAEIARRMEIAKNMAEDMGDKLMLDYFAHYHKIFMESQKTLSENITENITKTIRNTLNEKPPQQ
jgi:membrane protein YdbS with pleckstrin-like domain